MIYVDNVSKIYGKNFQALENVSLTITQGEFVSIVGHSGAGKTTLLKLIRAQETPTSGNVYFESFNVNKLSDKKLTEYRRKVGVVFQDFKLLADKTVYENIAFAMEAAGKTDEEIEADVPHVLDLVDLETKMQCFPGELSGGEAQRVAIARAIITRPDVVIADEPTGNLDPVSTYEIIQILKKINDLGTTVILTTHNKGVIDSLNKRVITMEKGKIVRDDIAGKYVI